MLPLFFSRMPASRPLSILKGNARFLSTQLKNTNQSYHHHGDDTMISTMMNLSKSRLINSNDIFELSSKSALGLDRKFQCNINDISNMIPMFGRTLIENAEQVVINDVTNLSNVEMHLDSVLRKRRKKMKKHKLRKRRKRQRAEKRKLSQGR
ncbi:mitochondrial 37S ribosomal protein mS38 NDAI_0E04490 [Naumovozyma dairenensis CBS 421]|uniref:Small ribosomal subunit protein mS38 n=1 Tax=Naumovozyma dairenensis (strain ATCC 10597 / BCRC 20456 / CBS 421 / NBRC 0211 / NRRL Y-12639) TaxID=1071378 RepID=G0WBZ6_NAUDC|nr:hypothetical protein NDAI_0E04490 [Naumovozyma dairenensis CBS 421]CCD25266.1 hypothetical protein NDAI_0E04490 [Naumovozyma dairenensis CBS 421]